MDSEWYVLQTLSGQEQKVKDSLEKRIPVEEMGEYVNEVLVPMEKVVEVRNGKKSVTSRKLFPGYVFVDMVLYAAKNKLRIREILPQEKLAFFFQRFHRGRVLVSALRHGLRVSCSCIFLQVCRSLA